MKPLQMKGCAPVVRQCDTSATRYVRDVLNREKANGTANRAAASAAQCWRLNQLGLLEIRETPAEPISRDVVKQLLAEAVKRGLWQPEPHKGKR